MFTIWVILEIGVRQLKKNICVSTVCTVSGKIFGYPIYCTGLYIKAVILADFHKTIEEEWTFVTEISSHLIA